MSYVLFHIFRRDKAKLSQVVFGDPFKGRPFPNIDSSKVKTFCFALDLICEDTIVVDSYHLSYAVDATPAAEWVAGQVKV